MRQERKAAGRASGQVGHTTSLAEVATRGAGQSTNYAISAAKGGGQETLPAEQDMPLMPLTLPVMQQLWLERQKAFKLEMDEKLRIQQLENDKKLRIQELETVGEVKVKKNQTEITNGRK
jgi:hypothetical protein